MVRLRGGVTRGAAKSKLLRLQRQGHMRLWCSCPRSESRLAVDALMGEGANGAVFSALIPDIYDTQKVRFFDLRIAEIPTRNISATKRLA